MLGENMNLIPVWAVIGKLFRGILADDAGSNMLLVQSLSLLGDRLQ